MHWLQSHWYRITPLHLILVPLSLLFRLLVALRVGLYQLGIFTRHKLSVPVVIVGNLTVGGTGKTPLTIWLAQQLIARGRNPIIVSRGYGGTIQQPQQVFAASDAQQVGDEPLLLAQRNLCPVWVGANRATTARAALLAHPSCDVVLCDDGLQHYRLQRDFEIALIDGSRLFGNGWLLPAGPLREPITRLQSVDAIVVNGGTAASAQYAMQLTGAIFHNLLDPGKTITADDLQATRNHAVAGIADPQRFFRQLESLAITAIPHPFPDHHAYCANDLQFADCDALLMTEKDAVKCAAFADERYWVLRVDAQLDSALIDHLLQHI